MSREPSFCYICLDNEKRLVNMDRVDSNKVKLLDMLTYLSFETGCIEDDIPMYICDDCNQKVRAAYKLKVKCQKNNIHVRRYIFYLRQFTHPTSFTNEQDVKNNKQKPPENTKKKPDEFITIRMDLTDIGDESDIEFVETSVVLPSQSESNTLTTEVNNLQRIAGQQCEISVLSKRPEFNSMFKQPLLVKVNNTSQTGLMKIIKSSVSDRKVKNRTDSVTEVGPVLSQTGILSNRPEFNVYKNIDSQNNTKTNNTNKETTSLTEQNPSAVHSEPKSNTIPPNNVINSTNKKNSSLKKSSDKNLQETKTKNRTHVTIEPRPEFDEFDIISTVKLRKRGLASVKAAQPINNNSFKKRKVQKMTYHVKKDKKAIQRMNKCKVVLQRCEIIVNETLNSENNTITDETSPNNIIQDDILNNSDDKESIDIKEETNNELDNKDSTILEKNTLLINNTSEQSIHFENVLIKQEICDDEEIINNEIEVKKSPQIEDDEFSFKIEIVDDSSSNSVTCYSTDKIIKLETVSEDSKSTENSLSTETAMYNSTISNGALLTTREQSVSLTEDLTKAAANNKITEAMIVQGNCPATVGNGKVTKATDKPLELVQVTSDNNVNTTSDSDLSGELIIDEDVSSSDKPVSNTVTFSSFAKPTVSKILSPRCSGKNVYKRFLNFTPNAVSNQASEHGHLSAEKADGTPAVKQAAVVKELNKDLSTVQLPNYKFPVSKRLLNFRSKGQLVDNSAQTSGQVQLEQNTLSANVSKPKCKSSRKTTVGKAVSHLRVAQLHNEHRKVLKSIGSPTSVETKVNTPVKSTSTARKLPRKVGNPVMIGSNVGKTEESPVNLQAKQIQLMVKYMGEDAKVGINGTRAENTCQVTSVGSSEVSVGIMSTLMTVASSKQDQFTATSNGTKGISSASLAHVEACSNGLNKCTQGSLSHCNSNELLSPSKVTIEKNAGEFVQPERRYQYKLSKQTDELHIGNQHHVQATKSLKCPVCNKHFRTTHYLKKHALIHKNFYRCPICTVSFSTKTKFKVHMLVHEERKHKCLICDVRTSTDTALVHHYKTEHKSTKICGKCKVIFKTDSDYIAHMKHHYLKRSCAICNQMVGTKSYEAHMRAHERSKCSLCDKYFDTKLNEHNCTEQWERTYKCTECERAFYFAHSLEKHMLVHYEMKCFICQMTFSKPYTIVEHMSKHIGPNGYQCPVCDQCTFSKDSMKLHMTDHKGEINKCTG